jgi:DNA polymerase-3 subunit gamma/tau
MQKSQLPVQGSRVQSSPADIEDISVARESQMTDYLSNTASNISESEKAMSEESTLPEDLNQVQPAMSEGIQENPKPDVVANETALGQAKQVSLNEELLSIEEQATQLHHSVNTGYIETSIEPAIDPKASLAQANQSPAQQKYKVDTSLASEQSNESVAAVADINEEKPLAIDSPVSSVLATRNMLRSRKKALEKQVKKPSDASQRQSNKIDSAQDVNSEQKLPQPVETLAMSPEPQARFHQDNIDPTKITKANQVDKWAHMIDSMQLTARIRQLAIHATISEASTDDNLILQLNQATRHLNTEVAQQQLQSYICEFLSRDITVTLNIVEETVADPYQIQGQINDKRLEYAKELIKNDETVIALQENFQANLDEGSISAR